MSGLSPEERNRVINQIHGLVESLREEERGLDIRGCRAAVVPAALLIILLVLGYVRLGFRVEIPLLPVSILLGGAIVFLIMLFITRAMR